MTNSTEHIDGIPEGEDWEDIDDTEDPDPDGYDAEPNEGDDTQEEEAGNDQPGE